MDGRQFDAAAEWLARGQSRRRVLARLTAAVSGLTGLALAGEATDAKRGKGKKKKKGKPKVELCHNGKTIKVGNAAVASHLAHGDYRGACFASCPPGRCSVATGEVCCPPGSAVNTDTCRPSGGTCCGAGGFVEGVGAECCPAGSRTTSCPTGQVCCPATASNDCAATAKDC